MTRSAGSTPICGTTSRAGSPSRHVPLDEVARYLGGFRWDGGAGFEPRKITVIDAGWRRDLDLRVVWPASPDAPLPAGAIWPAIEHKLAGLVREHRSTIIFTNTRRMVEKLTAWLNEPADEPERDGERVAGARIDRDELAVSLQPDHGVKRVFLEVVHDNLFHACFEAEQ